jgi:putative hydrolases of HD superfamily
MNPNDRLSRQIGFLVETEKLKAVLRRTSPIGAARRENTGEHSWTLALMAIVLAEHANQQFDLLRVLRMLLVHDIVEIDAGDTFCYDTAANATKADREARAAERIFGLLPEPQATEFRELWQEFEARASAEATFANSLDRLMPLLQNSHNDGGSWREHGVTAEQAFDRNRHIGDGSISLWDYAQTLLTEAQQLNLFSHANGNA